ncbi:PLP-dependent transferase [Calocera viscosa TUFC12733]|uniref:PLP-dependent transferase n=1 Tax=Calocera viscosa (strain TUFC12733) TaxID=1330018 RepID=A0A167FSJ3_CALVF|nr:PLP-dependent transferase [Calocera viscosa TUFC12733]
MLLAGGRMCIGKVTDTQEGSLPKLGHALLPKFAFEPGFINLNHGSYGSLPLPVQHANDALALKIEQKPDLYMRSILRSMLADVRERVAKVVNAETEECVIVPNATHGVNTVLFNLEWKKGDVIVTFSSTYGAVQRAVVMTLDRIPGLEVVSVPVTYPLSHAALLSLFTTTLTSIPRHDGQKVLAIIDGIVSMPGVLWPWEKMCALCKEHDVLSLVDGAHLIGQVPVDLSAAQPDFWVSNGHKWLFTKRASAVFYVPKRNQHLIKFTLPTSVYVSPRDKVPQWEGSKRFEMIFEYCGTIDYVPYLSFGPALEFRASLGGEERINTYCHALALEGGQKLAEVLGTEVLDKTGELTANMTNVRLPLLLPPETLSPTELHDFLFGTMNELADKYNLMIAFAPHAGQWWVRLSAQVWNEISDFEKAGGILAAACKRKDEEMKQIVARRTGPIVPVTEEEEELMNEEDH